MGQYQTRVSKSVEEEEEEPDIREVEESQEAPVTEEPSPVFGSPIETESYLANVARKLPLESESSPSPLAGSQEALPFRKKEDTGERQIPIVFRWDSGGNEVYICGSFNNWETKIPMTNSHGDFTAIVDLPAGRHEFKFFVDGQWLHDPNEEATDNGLGSWNNVVNVSKKEFDAYFETWDIMSPEKGKSSPTGSYSQVQPPRGATSSLPPNLPPLLQQTVLNQEQPSEEDPTLLPEPNHVILHHLYALSIKDNVLVLSATHRYQEKYVTTLLYRPV